MEKFKNKIKRIKEKIIERLSSIPKPILGLIFAIIVLAAPLFDNEISLGHDHEFHMTNLYLNYKTINIFKLNFLLPKIFGETIAKGFGYGTGLFYPPLSYYLTSYIASILNCLDKNIYFAISILEIITISLSGIFMYILLKRIFKEHNIASVGSISYISSTYFLCNIYTRCAMAEMLTFIFIPIIFLALYELFFGDKKRFNILFIIGYVGMINSHLVLSVYITLIILILFIFFPRKVFKKEIIKKLVLSSIIILLISSPYLVPLLEHKIHSDYTVFSQNGMYKEYFIVENSIKLHEFYTSTTKPNDIKVYVNLVVLISSIIAIVFNKKIFKNEQRKIYIITILLILITAYISSSYFPWETVPQFLKMIQFPWRLRGILAFGLAILAGNSIKVIKGENKTILIILLSLSIIFYGNNTIDLSNFEYPLELYNLNMGVENEYLPTKTNANYAYYLLRKDDIKIKNGEAAINILENKAPYLKSEIELTTDKLTIELPRLYYLGYEIKIKDEKENINKINYYENEFGFIEIELNQSGLLEVSYKGTLANKISNYICLITIIICSTYLIFKKKITNFWRKNEKNKTSSK